MSADRVARYRNLFARCVRDVTSSFRNALLVAQGAYGFDHLPTDDEMLQLAERWRPHRSLAVSYLFASEFDEPTSAQA